MIGLAIKKDDFIKMNQAFDKIYSGNQHKRRALDFIAKKESKFYAIEAKTNKAILRQNQKKELELSKNFGFIPIIVKTKVNLIANLDDVKLLRF
jgi:predicted transcriptional regulator